MDTKTSWGTPVMLLPCVGLLILATFARFGRLRDEVYRLEESTFQEEMCRLLGRAKRPKGVPEENWLSLNQGDYGIDIIMRLYAPDLERFKTWTPPRAEKLEMK